jgi:hypothetical protein
MPVISRRVRISIGQHRLGVDPCLHPRCEYIESLPPYCFATVCVRIQLPMQCPNCKQRQFKPSRSMNKQLSLLGGWLWVRLRCYRCGTLKTTWRAVWLLDSLLTKRSRRGFAQGEVSASDTSHQSTRHAPRRPFHLRHSSKRSTQSRLRELSSIERTQQDTDQSSNSGDRGQRSIDYNIALKRPGESRTEAP